MPGRASGETIVNPRSRRRREIALVALAVTIALGLLGYSSLDIIGGREHALTEARQTTHNLARTIAQHARDNFASIDMLLRNVVEAQASDDPSAPDRASATYDRLRGRTSGLPFVSRLAVTDAVGMVAGANVYPIPPVNIADRPYFRALRDDPGLELVISGPVKGWASEGERIAVARRLSADDGSFAGVAVASIDPGHFSTFFDSINVGNRGTIGLYRRDGMILAQIPGDIPGYPDQLDSPRLFETLLPRAPHGTFDSRFEDDGAASIVSYRTVQDLPLVVTVSLNRNEILVDWQNHVWLHAFAAAGLIMALTVFATLLVREFRLRARADAARQAHQRRLVDFAEASSDWFWEQDDNLRFTFVSSGIERVTGMAPAEHIGLTRAELMPADADEAAWQAHMDDLVARRPFRDFRFRRRGGGEGMRHVSISGKPIFDEHGTFKGYRGVGKDLTTEIEAQEAAARAQKQLADAVEGLTDAFALFDADDRLVLCNEAYRRWNFATAEDLKDRPTFESILRMAMARGRWQIMTEDCEAFVARRMAMHRRMTAPIELAANDGSWIQVREHMLADGHFALFATDISEIKRREREVANKSHLLQTTLERMGEGISVVDGEFRLIAWNDRFLEMLDLPRAFGKVGTSLDEIVRWQAHRGAFGTVDVEAEVQRRRRLYWTDKPMVYHRTDPSGRVIELRRNPMPGGGFVTIYADVTERNEAESKMIAAKEQAEIANRSKSEFLANMSHELRTPLNAVLGFSDMLLQQYFGTLTPKQQEYIEDIRRSGSHLLALISDVLDVAKIEAGKFQLHEEPVELCELVDGCVTLVSPSALKGEVDLKVEMPRESVHVNADERALKQVLLNLLSNAVKFTPHGGCVTVTLNCETGRVALSVADTGIGIAAPHIASVLKPFGRVENPLSRRFEGTGLGLPLAKSLVELHGGTLEITSDIGRGTTIHVLLPATRMIAPPLVAAI